MHLIEQATCPMAEYRTIPLSKNQIAIVDAMDYEWLSRWKWLAAWAPTTGTFYAQRSAPPVNGSRRTVIMHREILGLQYGDRRRGDHRNGDTLDNRRVNLRIATRAQNTMNSRVYSNNRLGVKGVFPSGKRFGARLILNRKYHHLGIFATVEEASAAYCHAAKEVFGEFARL